MTNNYICVMSNQNGNNRSVYRITSPDSQYDNLSIYTSNEGTVAITNRSFDDSTGHIAYDANFTAFQVGKEGNYYTFLDINSNQYIGNVSGDSNKIVSYSEVDDHCRWSLSNTSTGMATLTAKTGNRTKMSYNYSRSNAGVVGFEIFASYASARPGVCIYRKVADPSAIEYYSNTTEKTYSSSVAIDKVVDKKEMYTAGMNVADPDNSSYYDTNKPFNIKPTETVTVTFNFSSSKVTYNVTAGGWTLVNSTNELTAGDTIVFAYKGANQTFGAVASKKLSGVTSTFSSDKTTINTFGSGTQEYVVETGSASGTLAFKYNDGETTPTYIRNYSVHGSGTSTADLTTQSTKDGFTSWVVTISNGDATIRNYSAEQNTQDENNNYLPRFLRYKLNNGAYSVKSYSETESGTGLLNIYRYNEESQNADLYISDLIGDRYDPDYLDVTGDVSFYSSYFSMANTDGSISSMTLGSKFYSTSITTGAVVMLVDKVDSRDLGTIVFDYSTSSSGAPQFCQNGGSKTMSTAGARDIYDGEQSNTYSMIYTMNSSNIANTALCALDADGNICCIYNSNGTSTSNSNAIVQYVVVITSSTGTINVSNVEFTFTSAEGNVGDFGNVGYRSATYNNKVFDATNSRLTQTIVNMYYHVDNENQLVSYQMSYNAATSTYTITFTSNVDMEINVFNYDPNNYHLIVNGVEYYYGTNVISITASS